MKSISGITDVLDPGDEPEEFKKSKFWHKLFLNYKKAGLVIGAIFLSIFIFKTMFMLFGAYQGYQDNSHKLDSLYVQYAKSEKVINMRIDSMGSAKKRTTNQHILTINGALTSLLNDYKFRNVIYKQDANNVVYYFTNGMLYSTKTDQATGDLYFIDESGQAIWCR